MPLCIACLRVLLKHHLDNVGGRDVLAKVDVVEVQVKLYVQDVIALLLKGAENPLQSGTFNAKLAIDALRLPFGI